MKSALFAAAFAFSLCAAETLQVTDVRQPARPAWGTNSAQLVIRNNGRQSAEMRVEWQSENSMIHREWHGGRSETIPAGAARTIDVEFVIPAFPGLVSHTLRVRNSDGGQVLWQRTSEWDFPFANTRINALRIPPGLQSPSGLARTEYPKLRMEQRARIVMYYLDGDSFVQSRARAIAAEREQIYRKLAQLINPAFSQPIAVYLFPDADSKLAYTNHRGLGMASGRVLAEILTRDAHIDPYHEVAHIIAGSIGEPPALFDEGLATWMQEGHAWSGYPIDAWTKAFAAHQALFPLEVLMRFEELGAAETRGPISYPQSGSFVGFLIEKFGWPKFLASFRELKKTKDPAILAANSAVFTRIYAPSVWDLEREWLAKVTSAAVEPVPESKIAEVLASYR